jgi:serine protease Do
MNRRYVSFVLAILLLILTACNQGGGGQVVVVTATTDPAAAQPTSEPKPTEEPEEEPTEEPEEEPTEEPEEEPTEEPEEEPTEEPESGSTIEQTEAATVEILVEGQSELQEAAWGGSGVVYDPSGLVITNYHVVGGAAILEVRFEGEDRVYPSRVLGVSPCDDLAVVQIEGGSGNFPSAQLGGTVERREDVYVIGFPITGADESTQRTTRGVVSRTGVTVSTDWADFENAIETDASINPGNSGGPMVNENGEVVGINSLSFAASEGADTNYAISMEYARRLIDRMAQGENIDWIGVNAIALSADAAAYYGIAYEPGLYVVAVDSGSPADEIGIQEGDYIVSIESQSLGADNTMNDYCRVLRSHDNDDVLDVTVLRGETRLSGQINGDELEGGETIVVAEPTPESGNTGDPTPEPEPSGLNYVEVQDDTGSITLSLPDIWSVATGDLVLMGAPDIEAWQGSFGGTSEGAATVSGFFIQALTDVEQPVTIDSVTNFLDTSTGIPENCTFDAEARSDYDDGVYQGRYDALECDTGTYYTLVAFDPDNPTFLIWIEAYVITDEDAEIFQTALNTFFVTPQ